MAKQMKKAPAKKTGPKEKPQEPTKEQLAARLADLFNDCMVSSGLSEGTKVRIAKEASEILNRLV